MLIQGSSTLTTYAQSAMVFTRNTGMSGGGLYGRDAKFDLHGSFEFRNNSAKMDIGGGGAFGLVRSNVIVRGQFLFEGAYCFKESTPLSHDRVTQVTRRPPEEVSVRRPRQFTRHQSLPCALFATAPALEEA
jgi:hypothetical protein